MSRAAYGHVTSQDDFCSCGCMVRYEAELSSLILPVLFFRRPCGLVHILPYTADIVTPLLPPCPIVSLSTCFPLPTTQPPTAFRVPPALLPASVNPPSTPSSPITPKRTTPTAQSLIDRYGLSARVPSRKGKERDSAEASVSEAGIDGRGKWEDTKEKRERELKERKERMILEARR